MTKESGVYTAAELYDMVLPPMRWVAVDFMAEGITMLSGRPKGGKTLLALQLGIAVEKGELFLGRYQTVRGAVLYVNVDDPSRKRLQENLHRLGGRADGLTFMSALPELDNGGLEILDKKLARMAEIDPCRLLILDTLTALRREQSGKNLVKADYEFIAGIKGLESKHGCTVLLISHTRKDSTSSEKVDGIDSHLGTTGLTAAVDAVMLLTGADDTKKILKAKGRDISPFEVYLELQVEDRSGWVAVDAPVEPEKKKEPGALRQRILDAVLALGPCGPSAVSKFTNDNLATVRKYLPRMAAAGQLWRNATGCYSAEEYTPSILGVSPVSPTETPETPETPNISPTQPVSPTEPDALQRCSVAPATPPTPHATPTQPAATPDTQPSIVDRVRAVIDSIPRNCNDLAELAGVSTRQASDALDELVLRGDVQSVLIDDLIHFYTGSPVIVEEAQGDDKRSNQWLNYYRQTDPWSETRRSRPVFGM